MAPALALLAALLVMPTPFAATPDGGAVGELVSDVTVEPAFVSPARVPDEFVVSATIAAGQRLLEARVKAPVGLEVACGGMRLPDRGAGRVAFLLEDALCTPSEEPDTGRWVLTYTFLPPAEQAIELVVLLTGVGDPDPFLGLDGTPLAWNLSVTSAPGATTPSEANPLGVLTDTRDAVVILDTEPPLTTLELVPATIGGWSQSDVTAVLTPVDAASGATLVHVTRDETDPADPDNPARETFELDGPSAEVPLAEGQHLLRWSAEDAVGNVEPADPATFVGVDLTDPVVQLLGPGPGAQLADLVIRVQFSATDANLDHIDCVMDGAVRGCTGLTETTYSGLGEGTHSVQITAVDKAGRRASSPAGDPAVFTIDRTAPDVTITSPVGDAFLASRTMAVAFTVDDPLATLTCRIDEEVTETCDSATAHTFENVADAEHLITVAARDLAGNRGTDTVDVNVDATAPVVTITTPADNGVVGTATTTLAYTVADANPPEAAECSIDGGAVTPCSLTRHVFEGLAEGSHIARVDARDDAGNTGFDEASFTTDLTNPVVTVTSPAEGALLGTSSPSTTFTATDNVAVDEVGCSVDDEIDGWVACATGFTMTGLGEGDHTLFVRAFDTAGRLSVADVDFRVDLFPPVVSIGTPGNGNVLATTSVTAVFSAADPNLATVRCQLDSLPETDCTDRVVNGIGTLPLSGLAPGDHTFKVTATDLIPRATTSTVAFTVDLSAPTLAISSPVPGSQLTSRDVVMDFVVSDPNLDELLCSIDGPAERPCNTTTAHRFVGVADGLHTVEVLARDAVGHEGVVTSAFTVDATPPRITLGTVPASVPANRFVLLRATVDDNLGLAQATWSNGATALLSKTYATELTDQLRVLTFFPTEGTVTLLLRVTDRAGNAVEQIATIEVTPGFASAPLAGDLHATRPTDAPDAAPATGPTGPAAPPPPPPVSSGPLTTTTASNGVFSVQVPARFVGTVRVVTPDSRFGLEFGVSRASDVDVRIALLDGAPGDVPDLALHQAAQYLDVDVRSSVVDAVRLDQSVIRFTVPDDLIRASGATLDQVVLFHWNGAYWEDLPTFYEGQVGDMHHFRAHARSLSPFVIALVGAGGDKKAAEPEPEPQEAAVLIATRVRDAYQANLTAPAGSLTVRVVAEGDAFTLDVELPSAERHRLWVRTLEAPPSDSPPIDASVARYFDIILFGPDGLPVQPTSAVLQTSLSASEVTGGGGDADQILVVHAQPQRWVPVESQVSAVAERYVVRAQLPHFSVFGVVLDTQAPRVGLTEAPPAQLLEPFTFSVVASDNVAVATVKVIVEGSRVPLQLAAPFGFVLDPLDLGPGTTQLTFLVIDGAGNQAASRWTVAVPGDESLEPNALPEPSTGDDGATAGGGANVVGIAIIGLILVVGAGGALYYATRRKPNGVAVTTAPETAPTAA